MHGINDTCSASAFETTQFICTAGLIDMTAAVCYKQHSNKVFKSILTQFNID